MPERLRTASAIVLVLLAGTACTSDSNAPATAPNAASLPSTSTQPPATVITTTSSPGTTATTVDRLTEIAAIFEDLERRRLQAIYDQDETAFRSLYGNEEYLAESLVALRLSRILDPAASFRQVAISVVADQPTCIAVELERDYSFVLETGGRSTDVYVAEAVESDFGWGLAWVGGGWACDGPHPLS